MIDNKIECPYCELEFTTMFCEHKHEGDGFISQLEHCPNCGKPLIVRYNNDEYCIRQY